jgi:DNA-binding transcriptional LysR family regulator
MNSMRHIEVFRAVMLTRSMTGAADMLFVSQSAVSKIVREFEDELGFPLFTRGKGGANPTPEAVALYAEVERAFVGLDRISRTAERIRSRRHGQLRIVAMAALTTVFLPRVIRCFNEQCPEVSISLETYNSAEVVGLVATGLFDIGYAMTPIDTHQVVTSEVMHLDCVCLLPAGHRLAGKRVVRAKDFEGERFVSLANGNTTRLKTDALFKNENVEREMVLDASWSASVSGLVAEGLGVAIVEPFSAELARRAGCQVRNLAQKIEFSFAELRPPHASQNELANIFGQHFRRELLSVAGAAARRRAKG